MTAETIVLAGGLGTRLQGVLPNLPKAMAPVHGRPFLAYVLDWLVAQQAPRIILAVSHLRGPIVDFVGHHWRGTPVSYSVEETPLGTGGAVRLALEHTTADTVCVVNGDTWFPIDIAALLRHHRHTRADITLSAARVNDTFRYGALRLGADGQVLGFAEKGEQGEGLINGGVYAIEREALAGRRAGEAFSLERDILQAEAAHLRLFAFNTHTTFLDIGVPEDLQRAEQILPEPKEQR
ncbi:MAG: nucleotidyltransferase family protein [Candidatus Cloacimonetes bacterium]|nr:nucleotidyltransferase family protein [Candidatus Cloacimonadota bacterium]